jgi:4-amino-4-deoxy-L-arabinose transferase-like glycosyltransferase
MRRSTIVLAGSSVLLFMLWLPGLRYPILSDTAFYALLGESLWQHGRYELLDVPYAKHLPLHAFLSYPIVAALGYSIGMKVATLLSGIAVLFLTYLVLRDSFSKRVALVSVPLVAAHHGFVLMTMLGSADPLFSALFMAAVLGLLRAEDDPRWYLAVGLLIGCSALTRYNGVPLLLVLVAVVAFLRREDLRSPWSYAGLLAGGGLFGLWLLRNLRVFGNPFHTLYMQELQDIAPDHFAQAWSNLFYYLNPLHNLLPILFVAAIIGMAFEWKRQPVLLFSIAGVWALTAIWWVQAMRFAFPAYPLLIGFAVVGIFHVLKRFPKRRAALVTVLTVLIVITHGSALCGYTYGACNSFLDRTFSALPKDLGLTPEGFYTWRMAKDAFNKLAPQNAILVASGEINARMQREGFFRSDIRITDEGGAECPYYRIVQNPQSGEKVLHATEDHPVTYVTLRSCL